MKVFKGYQPEEDNLDVNNPPKGSGVPSSQYNIRQERLNVVEAIHEMINNEKIVKSFSAKDLSKCLTELVWPHFDCSSLASAVIEEAIVRLNKLDK